MTYRSDYTWPLFAERQRVFNWDKYEYKNRWYSSNTPPKTQEVFRNVETLGTILNSEKLPFDYNGRPKPIVGYQSPISHYPTKVSTICKHKKKINK